MNNFYDDDKCSFRELFSDLNDTIADMKPYDRERYLIEEFFRIGDDTEHLKEELIEMNVKCSVYEAFLNEYELMEDAYNEFMKIHDEYYESHCGEPFSLFKSGVEI